MQEFAGYRCIKALGSGGTATVYLAEKPPGPKVALKILTRTGRTEQMVLRFRREIDVLRKVSHPRILKLLDAGTTGEDLWYAMEFSEKRSLEDVFQQRLEKGGIFEIAEILTLGKGLAEALAYLHQKALVHRDLKPDNVLVDGRMEPTLMDFGLAKDFERSELTASEGMVMGTPRYMSPEQVQASTADARSDVYQVGLILYRGLTGKLPLEDENPFATAMRRMQEAIPPPSRLRTNLPPGIDRILLKCLRFHQDERYPDCGGLLADLEKLDPRTGEVKPGTALPGAVAESTVARAGAKPGGERESTIMSRSGALALGPPKAAPRLEPTMLEPVGGGGTGKSSLALALGGLALAVAVAGYWRTTAPGGTRVERLRATPSAERVVVEFETDRPATASMRLEPPGIEVPVSDRAARTHQVTVPDLEPGTPHRFRLVVVADGVRQETPWSSFQTLAAGAGAGVERGKIFGLEAEAVPGGIKLRWETGGPARCAVLHGTGGLLGSRVEADPTGERVHGAFLPEASGGEVGYQILAREPDGTESRTAIQTFVRGP